MSEHQFEEKCIKSEKIAILFSDGLFLVFQEILIQFKVSELSFSNATVANFSFFTYSIILFVSHS